MNVIIIDAICHTIRYSIPKFQKGKIICMKNGNCPHTTKLL